MECFDGLTLAYLYHRDQRCASYPHHWPPRLRRYRSYKHDIHNMGEASGKLLKLRLVTFRYKNDPAEYDAPGSWQRGDKVYPELVPDGALFDAERLCCSTRS